ncbi:MAG TPA: peptide-methionine (S)-S-oxide reductase MsrA [Patescibacteria group bacterium]|nr:peptide-methionine (S)-S-oxide reductase MsrA [Patescibacteria group bacterium]
MTDFAYFGGGCFWCTEAIFQRLRGVVSVIPGYAGGDMDNPNYEAVSDGDTGHAEMIRIEFDPSVISYEQLLDVFWHTHDPTTRNQQGADIGEQYRSVVLFANEEQKRAAEKSKQDLANSGEYEKPIVTEIRPFEKFFEAENYHHDYYEKHKEAPYCQIVINPKLEKFKKRYKELLK